MDIITDTAALKDRLVPLHSQNFITVDTEFLRERTYYPTLCLIQIGGKDDAFAIDPLADGIDLAPFFDLMSDANVIKVFHACQQDLEILYYLNSSLPTPLFDTQIAAQVLGYGESVGYGNLVEKICNVTLDKSSRHTDWSKRPLSEKQLSYAISDVTHLRDIYHHIQHELTESGRHQWVEEETERFTHPDPYITHSDDAWQKLKIRGGAQGQYLAIIKTIAKWREERAQAINKPRQWIMKSDAILEIASAAPTKPEQLKGLRFFSSNDPALCQTIIDAVETAKTMPHDKIQRKQQLPNGAAPTLELLKVLLKMQCDIHNVAPSIVAKTDDLEAIATMKDEIPDIQCLQGWRNDVFGKYALSLKAGNIAITVVDGKLQLLEPVASEEPAEAEISKAATAS